jgi:hypothetical protein
VLEDWTRTVESRGFALVPLTTVLRAKLAAERVPPHADLDR